MSNMKRSLIDKKAKCSCKGYNLDKLLQPNILILLTQQNLHGYSIIQELENKNLFNGEKADNTGIYRTLKVLEDKGLVQSQWELESAGPAKKIYNITEEGRDCLSNWIDTLETYRKTIDTIIEEAKEIFNQ
jgi:PadR family transcriptional regulator PadR